MGSEMCIRDRIAELQRRHDIAGQPVLAAVQAVFLQLHGVEIGELGGRELRDLVLDIVGIDQEDRHLRGIVHEPAEQPPGQRSQRRAGRGVARRVAAIGIGEGILQRAVIAQRIGVTLGILNLGARRDRDQTLIGMMPGRVELALQAAFPGVFELLGDVPLLQLADVCLLYTSDAADE